jgi:predicted  nucleic acid-binding Zn-ribbon protein
MEVGWDGVMPVAIMGMIFGAISGSLFGYRLGYDDGYEKGTPDREFIENAHKAFDDARELASKVELKEQYVEQRMEKAENLWSRSFQQNENASNMLKEYDRKIKEADKLLATADKKFREAEAKASELGNARDKIQRLEKKIARLKAKLELPIDEFEEED